MATSNRKGFSTQTRNPWDNVSSQPTISPTKTIFEKKDVSKEQFAPGDRVLHMTFGEGEVLSVRPMGADILYEVMFDKVGIKKLMATYAKLKKI